MPDTVRCPSCGAANRADLNLLRSGKTRCGKCKAVLEMPTKPVDTNDRLFAHDVLEGELPVLVDFWAPWCGPCRAMAPVLQQFAAKHAGRVKVVKLNTEEFPEVAAPYDVRSIPYMALFKGGQIVKQVIGAMPLARLEAELAGLV
jgi:thioredoxin